MCERTCNTLKTLQIPNSGGYISFQNVHLHGSVYAFIPLHISWGIHRTPRKGKPTPTGLWTPAWGKFSYVVITVTWNRVPLDHRVGENELQGTGRKKLQCFSNWRGWRTWWMHGWLYTYLTAFPIYSFFFFFFLGPHLWHMEVPRLGVKLELQLPAYTTATASWDPSSAATYTTAHSNSGSLTHWTKPGTTTSWILVRVLYCWAAVGTVHIF